MSSGHKLFTPKFNQSRLLAVRPRMLHSRTGLHLETWVFPVDREVTECEVPHINVEVGFMKGVEEYPGRSRVSNLLVCAWHCYAWPSIRYPRIQ